MSPAFSGRRARAAFLLVRWSGRDLRARWIQVTAIALVIAIGTGSYAGLSSVTRWRRASTDAGYAALNMHDLRVRLAEGAAVDRGAITAAITAAAGDVVLDAEERLVADIQVDASTPDRTIIVAGSVYGVDLDDRGGPVIDALHVYEGRGLTGADAGEPVVLLERNFARFYDLPAEGQVGLTGGVEARYVGHATGPGFFVVVSERGGFLSEATYAVVFTSLETAGLLSGRPGAVNDAAIVLVPGADVEAARARLGSALPGLLGGVGLSVTTRQEDPSHRLNDADIRGDQQIYDIIAALVLGGAALAAFNLTARIVEAQRREIGIAMTLGVPPLRIAIRPLLVGAEIALLGVAFGVGVGMLIGAAMASVLTTLQPLPEWRTEFQLGVFSSAAVLGFLLPFAASAWPVWRAVRVAPIDAMRAGYRSARGWGLAPRLRRLRPPGNTFWQIPVRNVTRAPRRTLLTALGVASAVAILVSFVGMIDSFIATIDRAERETLASTPDRVEVTLSGFYPIDGPVLAGVVGSPVVERAEPGLRLGSSAREGSTEVDLQLELLDLEGGLWRPTVATGGLDLGEPGVLLSALAARDLGLAAGDRFTLRHPVVGPGGVVSLVETEVRMIGTHPHPFRFLAYADGRFASLFGLAGMANLVQVQPAAGVSQDAVKRDLAVRDGVASVQGVGEVTAAIRDALGAFVDILRVIEAAVLLLALLIAFNSASINVDERAREHATMFAFGVPVRTAMRMAVIENLLLGLLATALGLLGGRLVLGWILAVRIPDTLPDIYIPASLSPSTLAIALVLGILAVALAPLLTWRKLSRMDVAAGLKVVE